MKPQMRLIWRLFCRERMRFATKWSALWLGAVGVQCTIYPTVKIYNGRRVSLGNRVTLNDFVHIWGGGGVSIGDDTMIASHSAIVAQTHDVDALRKGLKYRDTYVEPGPVIIGRNVWIGASVVILPNVTIGDGAIVGAGAVVTHDIPPESLAIGVPARVVRRLHGQVP
jgi:maltose O-acetyltransferase